MSEGAFPYKHRVIITPRAKRDNRETTLSEDIAWITGCPATPYGGLSRGNFLLISQGCP
jgi:hypothetical protein